MLVAGMLLSGLSYVVRPHLFVHSAEEIAYAREYARESLADLERTMLEAEEIKAQSPQKLLDFYIDCEEKYSRLKHAALYLKGDMAEDFVYAFDLAEQWCSYSARSFYKHDDPDLQRIAGHSYERARREFRLIMQKEYTRKQ